MSKVKVNKPKSNHTRAKRIVGTIVFTIAFLVIWNAVVAPAINAPSKARMACDDQQSLALDHGDQVKYDQLKAQEDSIKGC